MTDSSSSARDVAVWSLRDRAGNVSAHVDRAARKAGLAGADRGLAIELALGCVRRRETIRHVRRAYLSQPDKPIPGVLQEVLDVAIYQLLFLDRVPAFAAVNEAVEQASRFHHKRKAGFVNGVLRSIERGLGPVQTGTVPREPRAIPVGPDAWRRANRAVLPDPTKDFASYLAAAQSLPADLAGRWLARHGEEDAFALAEASNARAPMILRVNTRRTDVAGLLAALQAEGVSARPHRNGHSVVLDQRTDVTALAAFREGLFQPQDATPTEVIESIDVRPGMRVLDLCAAPGTKTTHLARRMNHQGHITAVDVSEEKLARIRDGCERLGVAIVETVLAERAGGLEPASYDLVVVDAPCSNTGVLARRAEARWRFTPEALAAVVRDQQILAATGLGFVKPGGQMLYSTCSVEPEECEGVRDYVLRGDPTLTVVHEKSILPGGADEATAWHDGGYRVVLQKP